MSPQNDAVRTLVDQHARFRAFLERRTGDPVLAEDILQEAFVKSLERGHDLERGEAATAWIYRMLRNVVTDRHRRKSSERRALEGLARELESPEQGELVGAVCQCLGKLVDNLDPSYADIVRRVDLEGQPLREYAASAGISPNNAGVRIHRARKALAKELARACGTCTTHGCLDCHCAPSVC